MVRITDTDTDRFPFEIVDSGDDGEESQDGDESDKSQDGAVEVDDKALHKADEEGTTDGPEDGSEEDDVGDDDSAVVDGPESDHSGVAFVDNSLRCEGSKQRTRMANEKNAKEAKAKEAKEAIASKEP
jgi:hypothetical protein